MTEFARLLARASTLHRRIVDDVPSLKRGQVWCHVCGFTQKVDSARCLATGWPMHCKQTMAIDSPEERAALQSTQGEGGGE